MDCGGTTRHGSKPTRDRDAMVSRKECGGGAATIAAVVLADLEAEECAEDERCLLPRQPFPFSFCSALSLSSSSSSSSSAWSLLSLASPLALLALFRSVCACCKATTRALVLCGWMARAAAFFSLARLLAAKLFSVCCCLCRSFFSFCSCFRRAATGLRAALLMPTHTRR